MRQLHITWFLSYWSERPERLEKGRRFLEEVIFSLSHH